MNNLQLLSQLRSIKRAGQFPYGPLSLTQNAPQPQMAPPPPPPEEPEEDPRLGEMQGQIEQSQQELQKLQEQTRQQDSELKSEKLRTQQAQAESQLMKRDADLTKREADLVRQQAEAQTQADGKTVPHFSPTAMTQLKNIQKKLQFLTKGAEADRSFELPASYGPKSQEFKDIVAARSQTDNGFVPTSFKGPNAREAFNVSQDVNQTMNTGPGNTPEGYDRRWLTTGQAEGLADGNWLERQSQRAVNLARPFAVGAQGARENWRAGNYGKAVGHVAQGALSTAWNLSPWGAVGNMVLNGDGDSMINLGMPETDKYMEDWTTNRLNTMESASSGRDLLQGLSNDYKVNNDLLGAPEGVSAQALNRYEQYAGLTKNPNAGPTFMQGTLDAYRGNQYGDPNTWFGQILNSGLPYLSKLMTGGPRPTLQPPNPGLYA